MKEHILLIALLGFISYLANCLYMMGGTEGFHKLYRRIGSAFVLALATNLGSIFMKNWSWQLILIFPSLFAGFSLGYGDKIKWRKILKRTIFALACISAGFFGYWAMGFPKYGGAILSMQFMIGSFSIFLGVENPYDNAPLEQFIICLLLTITIPFWGFVR